MLQPDEEDEDFYETSGETETISISQYLRRHRGDLTSRGMKLSKGRKKKESGMT
jgi:hypothetical protein